MISVKYVFDMPRIKEGTEFCAIFENKDGKTDEEWFVCDDAQGLAEALRGVASGRILLGLFRAVDFEIKG